MVELLLFVVCGAALATMYIIDDIEKRRLIADNGAMLFELRHRVRTLENMHNVIPNY